jgi:hypothetical protein
MVSDLRVWKSAQARDSKIEALGSSGATKRPDRLGNLGCSGSDAAEKSKEPQMRTAVRRGWPNPSFQRTASRWFAAAELESLGGELWI